MIKALSCKQFIQELLQIAKRFFEHCSIQLCGVLDRVEVPQHIVLANAPRPVRRVRIIRSVVKAIALHLIGSELLIKMLQKQAVAGI